MNCVIICIIALQAEIFKSSGYQKYVTQTDGSMDLLVQLASKKAKSITFVFNNQKIRKIISIQRKKEVIAQTMDKLRAKLIRWRKFTKTTMLNENKDTATRFSAIEDNFKRQSEVNEKTIKEWAKKHLDANNIEHYQRGDSCSS